MKIDILTLFPEMFDSLNHSILGRAKEHNKIEINLIDIRNLSTNKHKKVDDYTFGGGAGMLMTPEPLYNAIMSVKKEGSYVIYLSPSGNLLNQQKVVTLAKQKKHIILVCGHYEGIDERVIKLAVDEEISIGDYVLTGGELAAMIVVDAVSRYIDGVLGAEHSTEEESFSNGLLEYPQYTRPQTFMGLEVPEVLVSGHHENIKKWREQKSLEKTKKVRPDLLKK
ncbi:MAG: tRNA (guanosine(37)-N1)-methyltransferase TrmD [Tenericutes bacterium HGW-Tenericutes-4]|nr:MAG: tRNA (guanosine(37)-N1)-methyltransferase TrmD [Tenericutes bacterium HGW-Tenericutes-4]